MNQGSQDKKMTYGDWGDMHSCPASGYAPADCERGIKSLLSEKKHAAAFELPFPITW